MMKHTVYGNRIIKRKGYYESAISHEDEMRIAVADLTADLEKDSSVSLNPDLLLNGIISILKSLLFVIKVVVLISFSTVYFVAGSVFGIMYLILYEKLFKTIFLTPSKRRNSSPYFYRWKKHHLDLNYEV